MAQAYSITPLDSEGAAMQVVAVSGNAIAQLDEDELHYMVESGQSVRDLKRLLSAQVGCSRFQQRLFSDELGELEDDLALRTLSSVQLIILPLCAPDKTMEEELLRGCAENNVAQIEWLLQKPLDPNRDGLVLAASCGHLEVVRLLLEAGVDKDAADTDGWTALHIAAENGHSEVVRLLLEAGADKDAADIHFNGWTALHFSARNGHLEVARLLLEARADKDAATADGLTALHIAAREGYSALKVVRLLCEAGADKDAADIGGSTALHFAARNGHLEVVRLLLEAGADKDAADTDGCTALGFAAYNGNGHLEVVRSLPEAGTDTQGWTASTLATSCNHEGEQGSWPIV
ncbi:unnamed protein product [Durusdinium trenchii]|uniref:Ankyrin repeat domain-containing protein 50 n=1 Tax=Durusdinium trenchii TaxID=1381693 RepID=A0ABP0HWP9_9DINO